MIAFATAFALAGGLANFFFTPQKQSLAVQEQAFTVKPFEPSSCSDSGMSVQAGHLSLATQKININRATATELTRLPGIGPKLAEEIVRVRTQKTIFRKSADLLDVKGIGKKKLEKILYYIEI
ncbi:MAG: hypothetical protein A2293_08305 [Elusimicrobia bacterium RIFOXYB2_FULL_49_7]|nr:MAG: hypothetical protein A2293_08305 [Elusimicrobia bacterium RIFOXYB2_FULL_49_7]